MRCILLLALLSGCFDADPVPSEFFAPPRERGQVNALPACNIGLADTWSCGLLTNAAVLNP